MARPRDELLIHGVGLSCHCDHNGICSHVIDFPEHREQKHRHQDRRGRDRDQSSDRVLQYLPVIPPVLFPAELPLYLFCCEALRLCLQFLFHRFSQ